MREPNSGKSSVLRQFAREEAEVWMQGSISEQDLNHDTLSLNVSLSYPDAVTQTFSLAL
jgi:hypothetical protein